LMMTPTDNYNAIRLAEKRTYDDILGPAKE